MIRAHRWVLEARFPVLRKLFRDDIRRQRLDMKRYSTVSVARLYYQKALTNAIAFSLSSVLSHWQGGGGCR